MNLEEYENIIPNMQAEGLTWITPNKQCSWRIETILTKEPDTVAWIRSMQPGETFFDVGANIGQYSLLAAKQGLTVHAFEPESQNFALLCRNIAINKLTNITPWPLAVSDKPMLAEFHLQGMAPGGSCNSFDQSLDFHGREKQFEHKQGSCSTTLDIFSDKYGQPDHIKIDVDGFEHLVIAGSSNTLLKTKSVLIEINTTYPEHMELTEYMFKRGFSVDQSQVDAAQRKEGPFKGIGNWIFYKKALA